jgi:hypothetical protein
MKQYYTVYVTNIQTINLESWPVFLTENKKKIHYKSLNIKT